MEALSKASGAETSVGEGDKRGAELRAGSCYGRGPHLPALGGNSKAGGGPGCERCTGGDV